MRELTECLLDAPLFKGCQRDEVCRFFASQPNSLRVKEKAESEFICSSGEEPQAVMLLVEGVIYTTMAHEEGRQIIVETLTGPELLAPAFIYAEDNKLPVSIVSKTASRLLYVDRRVFEELMHRDRQVMLNFISILSDRLQRMSRHVSEFALLSLRERVIGYLRRNRKIESVEWLAHELGVSRPSPSRVLSRLKSEGVVHRTLDGIELA